MKWAATAGLVLLLSLALPALAAGQGGADGQTPPCAAASCSSPGDCGSNVACAQGHDGAGGIELVEDGHLADVLMVLLALVALLVVPAALIRARSETRIGPRRPVALGQLRRGRLIRRRP